MFQLVSFISGVLGFLFYESYFNNHVNKIKKRCAYYKYGTYSNFVREFKKNEMKKSNSFKKSYYSEIKTGCNYDHGMIKFQNVGMILNPLDYYRSKLYVKRSNKEIKQYW